MSTEIRASYKKTVIHELLPYSDLSKVADYTYNFNSNYLDYEFAKKYFEEGKVDIPIGGCTSVRKGNYYGRNFDWIYNHNVDFIVATSRSFGRLATIGFGGFSSKLTQEFVESGEYSDEYKVVPFKIVDGINESGVVVNTNVVPVQKGETTGTTPLVETKETICNMMLPRYILDKFSSATEAVNYIRDYVSVYNYKLLGELYHYDLHIMVADATNTYLIEFINNTTVINEISSKPYMTNFHLNGVTFNQDGSVYTPVDKDADPNQDPIEVNNIESHGSGLERFNLINSEYSDVANESAMIQLMNKLKYTNTYKDETNPRWYTEGVGEYESGDVTIVTDMTRFNEIYSAMKELYNERDRSTGKTWQTVHSCVYDIKKRSVKVIFQENEEILEYAVERPIQSDWEQNDETADDYIKNKPGIVKGLAEGSIRGINTAEENSEYQLGKNAVALGENTKAPGDNALATGIGSKAEKDCSVASGYHAYAKASFSQADGYNTQTNENAPYSHAEGCSTQTNNPSEHAQGQFNKSNTDNDSTFGTDSHTLFSIGNGTDLLDSKNAVEVMQNGDMYVNGIGGYNGKNYSEASTLQDIVNTQADWNQNDSTKADYIKNRICYEETQEILTYTTENSTFNYYTNDSSPIVLGEYYNFKINDHVYLLGPVVNDGTSDAIVLPIANATIDQISGALMYNPNGIAGSPNGEKFFLTGDGNPDTVAGRTMYFYKNSAVKIPEKFIPDTIARKTYVDGADQNLQQQIDAITSSTDVRDVVGTYAELLVYDTSVLFNNDVVKVLVDENKNNAISYYRWVITEGVGAWSYIGSQGPFYTKAESDAKYVPKTTTVNGKALSTDITLDKSDVGLSNVDNTSDTDKPISTATQTALNAKVDKTTTINSKPLSSNVTLDKSDVGLENVDNTSDLDKPISTATQTALGNKSNATNLVNGSKSGSVRGINTAQESSSYTIGVNAFAEGENTKASGNYSHAEGYGTTANGVSAHAEGRQTTASGVRSHAEGNASIASGDVSHAEGEHTTANHKSQHVFGEYNILDSSSAAATERGNYVEIVGNGTSSTSSNARTLDWSGNETLAGSLQVGGSVGPKIQYDTTNECIKFVFN